jgi:FlaG/FlaF family flagellin (archaellin)
MLGNLRKFLNSSDCVSGVVGDVLLIGIVVIVVSMLGTMVFSLDRPVDSPHVAVEKWARAPTDTIYIRHCGGDAIDVDDLKIMVNINGSSYVYSQENVSGCLNKSFWELGDVITINTNDEWSVPLKKGDPVFLHLVDMDSKQVFRQVKVIPGGGSFGGWLPPAQMSDSAGSSNITDVIKENDGNHTHYVVPQKNTSEVAGTGEKFDFGINLADYDYRIGEPVSNVKLRLVYETHDNSFLYIQLWVFDAYPFPGQWYVKSPMNESSSPVIYVTNLSDRINTVEDIEGFKVRIEGVGNAASSKEINVDYIAVSFE